MKVAVLPPNGVFENTDNLVLSWGFFYYIQYFRLRQQKELYLKEVVLIIKANIIFH